MNRLIFFFSICFAANPLDEWIDQNAHILKQDIKSVSFQLTVQSGFSGMNNPQILNGTITVGKNKKFRYEMGPRTVVSNGKVWKSYDERTDQIFIQNRDKKLEKKIFSWVKLKKLKKLPVKKDSDGSYKIKLFTKSIDVRAYFTPANNTLTKIIIKEGDIQSEISNIILSVADTLILDLGRKSSTQFDLR